VSDHDVSARVAAITGANGYLGSRLTQWLRGRGWRVYEFRRMTAPASPGDLTRPYALETEVQANDFRGVDALVHCAYDFRWTRWEDIRRVNVQGSMRLFNAARSAGVRRLVFISTMSAYDGCRSLYGRAKMEIEEAAAEMGAVIIRPGLVYGRGAGGMAGTLERVVRTTPVVPVIGRGNQRLYLVHVEDLCRLVEEICARETLDARGPIVAGNARSVTFKEILSTLARAQGRRVLFVPVPLTLVWLGLRLAEHLRLPIGFRSDSLAGLLHTAPSPQFAALEALGVGLRQFSVQSVLE
jgi:nucleoside-diphosphate-sugar epimerase